MGTTSTLHTVTSKDGTTIAVDVAGSGPPIVLISGGSVDRGANAGLAAVLQSEFTTYNYDRRGRGDSGDTPPYAVAREIEDIEAVIELAGGKAHLYGSSSGAGLGLEAAAAGAPVDRLVMWEPPYNLDPAGRPPADSVEQLDRMVAEGDRPHPVDEAVHPVRRPDPEEVGRHVVDLAVQVGQAGGPEVGGLADDGRG